MPTRLKPLLLPQLVEARKSEEDQDRQFSINECDLDDSTPDLSASCPTLHSAASSFPSPVTPTFSLPAHGRLGSSSSLVDVCNHTSSRCNPTSPSMVDPLDNFSATGRFLPGVKEEPTERDEDYDMLDDSNDAYHCFCKFATALHQFNTFPSSGSTPVQTLNTVKVAFADQSG